MLKIDSKKLTAFPSANSFEDIFITNLFFKDFIKSLFENLEILENQVNLYSEKKASTNKKNQEGRTPPHNLGPIMNKLCIV